MSKNLSELLEEIKIQMKSRDLSDEYLRENNHSTREEVGIGEYAYGITMIPCKWVYNYLLRLKQLEEENEENSIFKLKIKEKIEELDKMIEKISKGNLQKFTVGEILSFKKILKELLNENG